MSKYKVKDFKIKSLKEKSIGDEMLLSKLKIENGRVKTKDSIKITIEVDEEEIK